MAILERVMQMNQQGYTESQIINTLRQEGISPKEIYDALTQSKIKSELSQEPQEEYETDEMKPSMIQQSQETEAYPQEEYSQGYPAQAQQEYPDQSQETALSQQGYYPQYQEYQPPSPPTDIETINEIAEQIVEEKTSEIKKQISLFRNTNEETKAELERVNKRLEKLETNFNELQIAIIKKIGEYGENIKNISTEMHETQNSFSKILNPLTDNIRELQKITQAGKKLAELEAQKPEPSKMPSAETPKPEERRTKRPEPGFEEYLR